MKTGDEGQKTPSHADGLPHLDRSSVSGGAEGSSLPAVKLGSDSEEDIQKGILRLQDGRELEAEFVSEEQVIIRAYSGPIPQASDLAEYNKVVKHGGERIIRQFEAEGSTSRKLREKLTDAHIAGRTRGQWMAFGITLVCLLVTLYAIEKNQPWVAGLFGAATLGNVILALLREGGVELPRFGRKRTEEEDEED